MSSPGLSDCSRSSRRNPKEAISATTDHNRIKARAPTRIESILDSGSFVELGGVTLGPKRFGGKTFEDGVVAGWGTIEGRIVYVFSEDYSILGGSIGEASARKIHRVLDLAMKNGAPVIGLHESVGAELEDGMDSLAAACNMLHTSMMASGVIPVISVVVGPCVGIAAHLAVASDFTIMVEDSSYLFFSGQDVIEEFSGEKTSLEDLGGASVHTGLSGVAHLSADTDDQAIRLTRRLIGYLPSNNLEDPPTPQSSNEPSRADSELDSFTSATPEAEYDMIQVVERIVDDGELLLLQQYWAPNMLTAFARLGGRSIGLVGNQPRQLKGALDRVACIKAARFVRFCDAFNIPIVTLVDCPGLLPSVEEERGGIARCSSKLLYAYSEATVPKVAVITQRAYGSGYILMCNRQIGSDFVFAWPSASISVMGPGGIVVAMHAREIAESKDKEQRIRELTEEYIESAADARLAVAKGYVDDVIAPHETRLRLIQTLESIENKRETRPPRKHGTFAL